MAGTGRRGAAAAGRDEPAGRVPTIIELPPWLHAVFDELLAIYRRGRPPTGLLLHEDPGAGGALLAGRLAAALVTGDDDRDGADGRALAHPGLRWLQPEGKGEQIRIESIREVAEFVQYSSGSGLRCVVLDSADRLNRSAANALLKSLEEPSPGTVLLLVSDAPGRIPATVLSRCLRVRVVGPDAATARGWLRRQCPDAADAAVDLALFACGGGATTARDWLRAERGGAVARGVEACAAVVAGASSTATASEVLKEREPARELIDLWLRVAVARATGRPVPEVAAALPVPDHRRVASGWIERLAAARRVLGGTANPNVRLLVEQLLHEWPGG